ncbi:MAG: hypothetical protein AAB019_03930 [Planctomycetota bacterium]
MMINKGPVFDIISFITLGIFMMLGGYEPGVEPPDRRLTEPLLNEKMPESAPPTEKPTPTAPPDIPAEPKSAAPSDETGLPTRQEWGPDPFQPPGLKPKSFKVESPKIDKTNLPPVRSDEPPGLTLTGILYQPDRQTAIINNRVMRIGDIIDNAEIIEIQNNRVIFQHHDNKYMLKLGRPLQPISHAAPPVPLTAGPVGTEPGNVLETQETLEKTNETLIQLIREKSALSEQVNQLKRKLLTLQAEFEGEVKEKNNYLTQLKEVADKLITFTGENADLKGKNVVLEIKLAALEATIREEIETKTDCLSQLQETRRKITSLEAQLLQLNNDLSVERSQKNAYEQQVKELAGKIPELTKEALIQKMSAQKAADETDRFQQQIKDASDKISRLTEELISLRTHNNETTSKLATAEKDLNKKINTLTDSLQETNREKLDYLNQLKLANDRLQAQTNELNRLSNKNDSLDKNKQALESEIARLTEEKNRYFQSLEETNKKSDDLSRTNQELDEKLKSTSRESKFYAEQAERTKEQITNLTNQANELNRQINQVQQEKNNLNKQVQETTQKNIELSSQLEITTNKLNSISSDNNNFRQTNLVQQQTWQQKNDEFISQISLLTKEKINTSTQIAQLQNNIDNFTMEINSLRQKNSSLEKDLKSLQETLTLESGQKEKSVGALAQTQQELDKLTQRESVQREQIKTLSGEMNSLQTMLKEFKETNDSLKKENSEKTAYLDEIQSVLGKNTELFNREIEDLKTKNSTLKESIQNLRLEIEIKAAEKSSGYLQALAEAKKTTAEQTAVIINLHWMLAELYQKTNSSDESVKEYQILGQLTPGDYRSYYHLGVIYEKQLFRPAQSISYYQKYLELISALSSPPSAPYPDRPTTEEIIRSLQK